MKKGLCLPWKARSSLGIATTSQVLSAWCYRLGFSHDFFPKGLEISKKRSHGMFTMHLPTLISTRAEPAPSTSSRAMYKCTCFDPTRSQTREGSSAVPSNRRTGVEGRSSRAWSTGLVGRLPTLKPLTRAPRPRCAHPAGRGARIQGSPCQTQRRNQTAWDPGTPAHHFSSHSCAPDMGHEL